MTTKKNQSIQEIPISKKMDTCLNYLDGQLETSKTQTINIAETIIHDIKALTTDYYEAEKNQNLSEHVKRVREAQFRWVKALQSIILDHSDQVLSHEVMKSMQKFAEQLNRLQNPTLDLELPEPLQDKVLMEEAPTKPQAKATKSENASKEVTQALLFGKADHVLHSRHPS
jgi:hypothetical protein